ncbi:SseB family protein [Verrucosispora sp. FIM060022]|uniref:SseB family protein n=1 Tax=Verrucosispora sp. FIM060022 TaxID=1479020 RepID=UPI00256F2089|nr:SseB family protein [Verrucosispora sp. FIM060022]
MTDWEPATEAEAALRDALRSSDQQLYFRILSSIELLLPIAVSAVAGSAPVGWGTWTTGGRTHVLAFTSVEAMRACLGEHGGSARRTGYAELATGWPNHEWWLAVNPGLPIEGYLPAWYVTQLSRGDVRLPGRTVGARARLERVEALSRLRESDPGAANPPATVAPPPPAPPRPPMPSRGVPTPFQLPEVPVAAPGTGPGATGQPAGGQAAGYPGSGHVGPPGAEQRPGYAGNRPRSLGTERSGLGGGTRTDFAAGARPDGTLPPRQPMPARGEASGHPGHSRPVIAEPPAASTNGQPADAGTEQTTRRSFFEPASSRAASRTERATPPSRFARSGQPFPRRGAAPEPATDGNTRAFDFSQDAQAGSVPRPESNGEATQPLRPSAGLSQDPTQRLRFTPPADLTGPTQGDPTAADATQALPRRQSTELDEGTSPSVAEPVSSPPAPRRGFTPIVIEGTIIEARDLTTPPEPDVDRDAPPYASAAGTTATGTPAAAPVDTEPTAPIFPPQAEPTTTLFPAQAESTTVFPAQAEQTVSLSLDQAERTTVFPAQAEQTVSLSPDQAEPTTLFPAQTEPTTTLFPAQAEQTAAVPTVADEVTAPVPAPAPAPAPANGSSLFDPSPSRTAADAPSAVEPGFEEAAATTQRMAAPDAAVSSSPVDPAPEPTAPTAAGFEPANEVEENLLAAAGAANTDTFLSTLLLAWVLMPVAADSAPGSRPGDPGYIWPTVDLDDQTFVVVYTSSQRLADHADPTAKTIKVRFVQLIRSWPDLSWSFAVNPGTPVGAKLPGEQIVGLANWAAELGLGDENEPEPSVDKPASTSSPQKTTSAADPTRPIVMQKAIAPSQLGYYLERGYDRVSGFVHRATELAHLTTPAQLYRALGLNHPESPFAPDAEEIYVLRWPAHRPSLYRIPYGGQNEAAMRAMEGWVIERAPFRGNGFAPGESSEVLAEFKVDSVRLPHGAQLLRLGADGTERLVAVFDADTLGWREVGEQ